MSSDFLVRNWALLAASGILLAVALNLLFQRVHGSASGQLRRAIGALRQQAELAKTAKSAADKAESRLDDLLQKSAKIPPSRVQEAKGFLQDARALQKIADDKLLIAENHVRRIIHEEFPPEKHERLRNRYLPPSLRDNRPFSF
jgi:exonuclease VII small subunit